MFLIRLYLFFLLLYVPIAQVAIAYGNNKKVGNGSIYNTTIIRTTEEGGGVRNDTQVKYGLTEKITISTEVSLTGGGTNQTGFFGVNYIQPTIYYQLFKNNKIAWNIGASLRTQSTLINEEEASFIMTGKDLKYVFYTGFDVKINHMFLLTTQLMYRQHLGYGKIRAQVDLWTFFNDKWSSQTFWWETFDTRGIKHSSALIEETIRYNITPTLSTGVGIGYYWAHKCEQSAHNISIILLFSKNF